jgi:hypothetical protein
MKQGTKEINHDELDELNGLILDAIKCDPDLTRLQLCRWLNNMTVEDCKYCKYYANQRKRKQGLDFKPSCKHLMPKIKGRLKKLGVKAIRSVIVDHYQPRGWDFEWILNLSGVMLQ